MHRRKISDFFPGSEDIIAMLEDVLAMLEDDRCSIWLNAELDEATVDYDGDSGPLDFDELVAIFDLFMDNRVVFNHLEGGGVEVVLNKGNHEFGLNVGYVGQAPRGAS